MRLLQARKEEPALPGEVQRFSAGFTPSRASPAPEGGRLCARLARGISRARPETGLLVHIYLYISNRRQSEPENDRSPRRRAGHPRAEQRRGLLILAWLKAAFKRVLSAAIALRGKARPAETGLGGP